jgi:uncharacterized membrane protein YeaQ/YmgE (transglycosylase-associated protein family)
MEPGSNFAIITAHDRGSNGRYEMSIIGWIVLGLVSGFIASKIVNRQGEGLILDIVLGIVGAIVGGYLFSLFGAQGVSGVNIYSMFVAVIGAIVVLVIYHAVAGQRTV